MTAARARAKKAGRKSKAGVAAGGTAGAGGGNIHPIIAQAISNGARLDRGAYEVAAVDNPFGEVIIRGEMRRHKALRRVPHFETLYRSKVIDRAVFVVLEWYAGRLARAQSGMVRCGLDISGGGGSPAHHVPAVEAAMNARHDVEWARRFIPNNELRAVFDGVMGSIEAEGGGTFEAVGAAIWPALCVDRAKRKASSSFKIAANHVLAGAGAKVIPC